jgi:hypothetical protein
MALMSTHPLTKMSSRDISLSGKVYRCMGLTILPFSCANCLVILGASTSWSPKGLPRPVMGWLYLSTAGTTYRNIWTGVSRCRGVWNGDCGCVFDDNAVMLELRESGC